MDIFSVALIMIISGCADFHTDNQARVAKGSEFLANYCAWS